MEQYQEPIPQSQSISNMYAPAYMEQAHPNLIKWFEDFKEELSRLKHSLSGEVEVDAGKRGIIWVKKFKPKINMEGLHTLISYIETIILKSPLSDLTEEEINRICISIGDNIAKNLIVKYKDWEMDLDLSTFDLIVDQFVTFAFIVLSRAEEGREKDFLKGTTQVSEIHTQRNEQPRGILQRIFKK